MQRERLDEPGGVDLLDRDAPEGALVEVAELEHRGRAGRRRAGARAAAAGGGSRSGRSRRSRAGGRPRRDRRARPAPARPRASGCRRSRPARHRARRAPAKASASRVASSPAPRPSTRRGRSVVCMRCRRTSQPATARKPMQGGGDEPERLGARVQQGCGGDDQGRDERGGLGMTDETNSQRAVVLAAVAQHRGADRPGDGGRGDRRDQAGRRGTESEPPGQQRHGGQHDLCGALLSECERPRRHAPPGG